MPVEIKELHIKAIVSGKQREVPSAGSINQRDVARIKKEITKEVTDKILQILRKKNER
jgi:hypothetical protein